jgi:ribosomal protein L11 methyltransferase
VNDPLVGREGATVVARLSAGETDARRLADVLGEVFDPAETVVAAFAADERTWTVEILFHRSPDENAVRDLIATTAGADVARALAFATVADRDWVAAGFAGLGPVTAGRFVVHGAHDRAKVPPSRIGIEIEAALAFGTGHHGTTRGCLLALDRLLKSRRPRHILDIGTGSGVLAIAAARALRRNVLATDIDPRAVLVARENFAANRVGAFAQVFRAAGVTAHRLRTRGRFDLVMANILLGPLKGFAAPLALVLAPGGRLVLSGLLRSQAAAALAAYRTQRLFLERRVDLDGWVTLVLTRRRGGIAPRRR